MIREQEILIVEDEVLTAMSLQQDLKRSGYINCSYVTTGEKALSRIEKKKPSLIIMDISLAGELTGIETAEKVLAEHQIPVILSSGYDYEDLSDRISHLKNAYFLKKPLHRMELVQLLDRIISS